MTQGALANKAGISRQVISYLENNKTRTIASNHLARLADALGVTADYLLGRSKPKDTIKTDDLSYLIYSYLSLTEKNKIRLLQNVRQLQHIKKEEKSGINNSQGKQQRGKEESWLEKMVKIKVS